MPVNVACVRNANCSTLRSVFTYHRVIFSSYLSRYWDNLLVNPLQTCKFSQTPCSISIFPCHPRHWRWPAHVWRKSLNEISKVCPKTAAQCSWEHREAPIATDFMADRVVSCVELQTKVQMKVCNHGGSKYRFHI